MKSNEAMKSVALLALATLLVGGGLIYWQYNNRSAAQSRVASLEAELPDIEQVQADLATSQQELEDHRIRLEHLEKSLPKEAYIPTLLKELEMVGKERNLTVTGIRPILQPNTVGSPVAEDDSGYQKLDIDITGQGTYRAVLEMIASLKSFPKILSVTTIAIQPRRDMQSKSNELDATIRLRAYIFKEALAPIPGSSEDKANGGGVETGETKVTKNSDERGNRAGAVL
ncbi:MAG: type 4a pilus biogenesis protein PilO [Fimbriimonadaceae bacterium]|nr:MAG: type 4a pilus biogenesis protein PilO [Fimbriimonadaceae bacterium]